MWLVGTQNLFVDPDISFGLSKEECMFLEIAELWNATYDANAFTRLCWVLKLEFDTVLLSNLIWNHSGVVQISIVGVISGHVWLQWYFLVLVGQFLNLEDVVSLGVFRFIYLFVNLDVLSRHCIFHLHLLSMNFSGWRSGLHSHLVRGSSSMSNRRCGRSISLLLWRRASQNIVNISGLLVIEVPSIVVELALILAHCIFFFKNWL